MPPPRPATVSVRTRRGALLLTFTAFAAAANGCGSSHSGGGATDPASAVPATAPLYVGATVRPSGSEKTNAQAVGQKISHQANPYERLTQLLQTPGSPALSYSRDVSPWLGPQAGIFLASVASSSKAQTALLSSLLAGLGGSGTGTFPFAGGLAQGAILLDASDEAKARSFLSSQAQHAGAHATSYHGVSYQLTGGGVAFALVGRLVAIGSDGGVRAVIETTRGGAALARAAGYSKLTAGAPAEAIAHVYLNGTAQTAAAGLGQVLVGSREANVSLVPAASSLAIDADLLAAPSRRAGGGLLAAGTGGAQAFGELPADSWLAFGLGDVGATLGEDARGLSALASLASGLEGGGGESGSSGTLNLKGLLNGLLTPLGVLGAETAQAKRDFTSWMGSGGIFASGGNLLELKGAVVISSKDAAASHAAVGKLAAALRSKGASVQPVTIAGTDAAAAVRISGLPLMLDIASGTDAAGHPKFVLGLGEASVTSALRPSSTLSGAPSEGAAASALGEGIHPNLVVNVQTIVSLLEGVGLAEDPTLSKVLPYLRSVTTVSGGTKSLGAGVERARVVLGLH